MFLPGEFHRQRSLAGYSPRSHKESNTTKWLIPSWESYIMINSTKDTLAHGNFKDCETEIPSSVTISSAAQSCLSLCDPWTTARHASLSITNAQSPPISLFHWVDDAIRPSHPVSSLSPQALNISQHQGLFQWVSSSHQVGKVLGFQLQHQSFQWTPRTDLF